MSLSRIQRRVAGGVPNAASTRPAPNARPATGNFLRHNANPVTVPGFNAK